MRLVRAVDHAAAPSDVVCCGACAGVGSGACTTEERGTCTAAGRRATALRAARGRKQDDDGRLARAPLDDRASGAG